MQSGRLYASDNRSSTAFRRFKQLLIEISAAFSLYACGFWSAPAVAQEGELTAASADGKNLFYGHCAVCHEHGISAAPAKVLLQMMPPTAIYNALTRGVMRSQGMRLSDIERQHLAEYLAGRSMQEDHGAPLLMCKSDVHWLDLNRHPVGEGWGIDRRNTRMIPALKAGISARDLAYLKLRWAFAYPGVKKASAQPLVFGGGLFVGSEDGTLYALDAGTGCTHWTFQAAGDIRGALVVKAAAVPRTTNADPILYFGDGMGFVYAVEASTGRVLWRVKADEHPGARVNATPVLLRDRLYVPVTVHGDEVGQAPDYACCTGRGSVVALDAATGRTLWKRYTIPSLAVEQSKNDRGVPQWGPSGAGVWSTLLADPERQVIYFTTGNNYSDPPDDNSDAIFAIDLRNGEVKWHTQTIAGDVWPRPTESLKKQGPDIDFTAPPVLVRGGDGAEILVAGRKDGMVYGLDPDSGQIRWNSRISASPDLYLSALYFGLAAEGRRIFIPSVGIKGPFIGAFAPSADDGLYARDAFTGELLWSAKTSDDCPQKASCAGISTAPIGLPGVVFAGSMDGYVRAYDSRTGRVLWHVNTAQQYSTLNGDHAKGGAVAGNGIMIANGMLYINSGYFGLPGNVLLAFSAARTH